MVGYNKESKAYRVFDSENRRMLIRRDVIFNEKPTTINEVCEKQNDDSVMSEGVSTKPLFSRKCEKSPERTKCAEYEKAPAVTRSPYKTRSATKA